MWIVLVVVHIRFANVRNWIIFVISLKLSNFSPPFVFRIRWTKFGNPVNGVSCFEACTSCKCKQLYIHITPCYIHCIWKRSDFCSRQNFWCAQRILRMISATQQIWNQVTIGMTVPGSVSSLFSNILCKRVFIFKLKGDIKLWINIWIVA